jgi:hypothetical protein
MNGDIYCIADTTIVNNSVFNIRGNNMIRFSSSSAGSEFINNGTINKESSDTTEFILGDIFTNKGIINLNSGTVITRNVFTNTGSLVFNTGYFIIENNFNHNGGSITGTGHFINSSRLTLNTDQEFPATLVFTMDPTGSTVDGPGNLILNQDFTIVGSVSGVGILAVHGNTWWNSNTLGRRFIVEAGKTLTLATPSSKSSADLITNNGTIDWMDGDIYCIADTLIINNSVFNIRGNNTIHFSSSSAGSEFINNGTINKESSGTTEFILGDIFTNSLSGIIKGNGTINMNCPTFINNGVIAPGLSPGILEFDTHQPFSANSTLQIEMQNGAGAGIGHDQLIRNSNLTLAGTLTVTETGTVPNGTYTIISLTAGSISNTFSTVNLPIGYTLITNTDNIQLKKDLVVTPVKLISFTAALQNNIVLLHWVTENELNNKYFDIERGINGTDFVSIGRTGASTATAGRKEYSFTDQQPLSGINYYRLKQVDIDGRFEYSPVAKATIDGQENFMTIYPNPVKDLFQIGFNKINPIVQVSIIDTQGRQLISRQISNQSLLQLPVQNLAPGIYYIKATDGSKTVALPFLKK